MATVETVQEEIRKLTVSIEGLERELQLPNVDTTERISIRNQITAKQETLTALIKQGNLHLVPLYFPQSSQCNV